MHKRHVPRDALSHSSPYVQLIEQTRHASRARNPHALSMKRAAKDAVREFKNYRLWISTLSRLSVLPSFPFDSRVQVYRWHTICRRCRCFGLLSPFCSNCITRQQGLCSSSSSSSLLPREPLPMMSLSPATLALRFSARSLCSAKTLATLADFLFSS